MFKDNKSVEQAAEDVLRSYLLRRFSEVSKQFPQVSTMKPSDGVEKLLDLKRENKITIEMNTVGTHVKFAIKHIN